MWGNHWRVRGEISSHKSTDKHTEQLRVRGVARVFVCAHQTPKIFKAAIKSRATKEKRCVVYFASAGGRCRHISDFFFCLISVEIFQYERRLSLILKTFEFTELFFTVFCEWVMLIALVLRLQLSGVCYRRTVEHRPLLNNSLEAATACSHNTWLHTLTWGIMTAFD